MDIQRALALKTSKDLLAACHEAETRNVETEIISQLYRLYWAACDREQRTA